MKILLLVSSDVRTYYSASLLQRGHQFIAHSGGAFENPAASTLIKDYMECDGCLLFSDDPQMLKIVDHFAGTGKPVWRRLADVPRAKMSHVRLLYVLVPLFLIVVGALVIRQISLREHAKPAAIEVRPPVAMEEKAPVIDKANGGGPQADESSGKRGLTPDCEKELRRTTDLLRFFANRIQAGEEIQSIIGDMRQQEKRIAAVCPD
jgi:hypothetical protein